MYEKWNAEVLTLQRSFGQYPTCSTAVEQARVDPYCKDAMLDCNSNRTFVMILSRFCKSATVPYGFRVYILDLTLGVSCLLGRAPTPSPNYRATGGQSPSPGRGVSSCCSPALGPALTVSRPRVQRHSRDWQNMPPVSLPVRT